MPICSVAQELSRIGRAIRLVPKGLSLRVATGAIHHGGKLLCLSCLSSLSLCSLNLVAFPFRKSSIFLQPGFKDRILSSHFDASQCHTYLSVWCAPPRSSASESRPGRVTMLPCHKPCTDSLPPPASCIRSTGLVPS
jgi:hypothetical protein